MRQLFPVLLALLPSGAVAQQFSYGDDIVISQPVHHDLYIGGGSISINAPVHGDLVVAGGTVNINDSVTNDILVAGGRVAFNGHTGDDIRCAGGQLYIGKSHVGGDVIITGGRVRLDRMAMVLGNMTVSGGNLYLDGSVNGFVKAAAGTFNFNGTIEKGLECRAGNININGTVKGPAVLAAARRLSIGNSALFQQRVRYWSSGQPDFKQSAQGGIPLRDESLKADVAQWQYLGFTSFLFLLWYLAVAFIFIVLLQYLFGGILQKAGVLLSAGPVLALIGYGFLFVICTPLAIIAIICTVVGIPLGLLLLAAYAILMMLATVITSIVLANWLNHRYHQNWGMWKRIWVALGIFFILKLIGLIPFVGWLAMFIVICLSFGAILRGIRRRRYITAQAP